MSAPHEGGPTTAAAGRGRVPGRRGEYRTLAAAMSCIAIYAITMGLSYPLLSLILEARGVGSVTIGLVASAPSVAMVVVTPFLPPAVERLGIRAFVALCIGADLALFLLLPVLDSVPAWLALRLLAGAAGAGLFTAGESWINLAAREERRGAVVGIYTTVVALGFAVGPLVIPLVGTAGWAPFLVGGLFIALSAVPLALARGDVPLEGHEGPPLRLLAFLATAPTLAAAVLLASFKDSASFALLPVFAVRGGLGVDAAALMLTVAGVGAVALQVPIGLLADRVDRHALLVGCAVAGGVGVLLLPAVIGVPALLWPLVFVWGGLFAGVYTVAVVILGQRFRGTALVAANAAFAFLWGVGSLVGPVTAGTAMDRVGADGYVYAVAGASALFVALALLRRARARPG